MYRLLGVLVFFLLVSSGLMLGIGTLHAAGKQKLQVAFIYDGDVVTYDHPLTWADPILQKASLLHSAPGSLSVCEYDCGPKLRENRRYNWRIEYGQCWAMCDHLPFSSLLRSEPALLYENSLEQNKQNKFACVAKATAAEKKGAKNDPRFPIGQQKCFKHVLFDRFEDKSSINIPELDNDVIKYWNSIGYTNGGTAPPIVEDAYVDYVPLDEKYFLLLVLMNKEIRGWLGEWTNLRDTSKPIASIHKDIYLKTKSPFSEPFYTIGNERRLFFVTDSGKLYTCGSPVYQTSKFEEVWNDPLLPIKLVIGDASTRNYYAFFQSNINGVSGTGRHMYAKIEEKLLLSPYNPEKFQKFVPDAKEPIATIWHHANLLATHDKVRIKDRVEAPTLP